MRNSVGTSVIPAKAGIQHKTQTRFGFFRERTGRTVARAEMFRATAARMNALNAFASI
jgi:hypothetical protein